MRRLLFSAVCIVGLQLPLVLRAEQAAIGRGERTVNLGEHLSSYIAKGYVVHGSIVGEGQEAVLDGPFTIADPDGIVVFRGAARKGALEGEYLSFEIDGNLRGKGNYSRGVPTGQEIRWDASGHVSRIMNLDSEGRLHGSDTYFADSVLSRIIEWHQGEPISMRTYEAGQIKETYGTEDIWKWFDARRRSREEREQTRKGQGPRSE